MEVSNPERRRVGVGRSDGLSRGTKAAVERIGWSLSSILITTVRPTISRSAAARKRRPLQRAVGQLRSSERVASKTQDLAALDVGDDAEYCTSAVTDVRETAVLVIRD